MTSLGRLERPVADLAIAPVQDVLGLGGEARMNTPGLAEGNWHWRLPAGRLDSREAERLRLLVEVSGRRPGVDSEDSAESPGPDR